MESLVVARPRIVIIGGGFGGMSASRALKRANADILLIDRTNHHLFQPLLYQVASAALAPSEISAPIRRMLHKQRNTAVILAEVTHIDVEAKTVTIDRPVQDIAYDYLVVATGSRHAYFGHPEWEHAAPGLKTIEDASEIRRRFLLAFERAETVPDAVERSRYLTFVVVGGGPTGVELCGSLSTVARKALTDEFRNIDTSSTRIILLEGGPSILPSFPPDLAEKAREGLEELGVEVRTNAIVTDIDEHSVQVGDERIPTHTVFWAAGNA
ncbi:MAG: FAD-dependent oxidoreductase, partial [Gemmatimonadaceae bacterium]